MTSLMILEDVSSLGEPEERALLDNNIVPRITHLMSAVISMMQEGVQRMQSSKELRELFEVYRRCVTILSNLSQSEKNDIRREILNSKILDVLSRILCAPREVVDLSTLDCTVWFMHNLTKNFESRHVSEECEQPLIFSLLGLLHLPREDQVCQGIIRLTISSLINLTKCEAQVFGRDDPRCDFATKQIVSYERQNLEPHSGFGFRAT